MSAEESKQVTTKPKSQAVQGVDRLKSLASRDEVQKRFIDCLGPVRGPAFISSMISAVSSNDALIKCEPVSVVGAALIAASMDLPINPNLGFSYIVPYQDVAQFQMGWRGYVQLGMRTGQYKTMNATTVLEGQLVHSNRFTGEMTFQDEYTSEKVAGYLFYFKLINGYEKYTYMTKDECEKHAKRYSALYSRFGKGRWKDDFDAMALKTVVKRGLSRWGVMSIEMQRAVFMDEGEIKNVDIDAPVSYPDSTESQRELAPPAPKKQSRVSRIVEQSMPQEEPPPIESQEVPPGDAPI